MAVIAVPTTINAIFDKFNSIRDYNLHLGINKIKFLDITIISNNNKILLVSKINILGNILFLKKRV